MTENNGSFRDVLRLFSGGIMPVRAYYWTSDGESFVRELTEEEFSSGHVPDEYMVRTTPVISIQRTSRDSMSILCSVDQFEYDHLPKTTSGYYVHGVFMGSREEADILIDALIKQRDRVFPTE